MHLRVTPTLPSPPSPRQGFDAFKASLLGPDGATSRVDLVLSCVDNYEARITINQVWVSTRCGLAGRLGLELTCPRREYMGLWDPSATRLKVKSCEGVALPLGRVRGNKPAPPFPALCCMSSTGCSSVSPCRTYRAAGAAVRAHVPYTPRSDVQVCLELQQTWMESGVSEDAVAGHIQVGVGGWRVPGVTDGTHRGGDQ